jgi:polysaccharide export outer membrane protein
MFNPLQQPSVKKIPTVLILLLGLIASSCSTRETTKESGSNVPGQAVPVPMSKVSSASPIGKGDQINMSVWGYPEFTTNTTVKETGTIVIPLIGEVFVAGLTKDQFSEMLRERLSQYVKGEVRLTINIVSAVVQKINVFGAVSQVGSAPVVGDESLLEVIISAGGFSENCDLEHIKVWRAGENSQPIEVDLESYLEKGNIQEIPIIHPGDMVFVPRNENLVREVGDFLHDLFYLFGFFTLFR